MKHMDLALNATVSLQDAELVPCEILTISPYICIML